MFDSALAFNRYRLEVVRSWPASEAKEKLIVAIEGALRKSARPGQPRRLEGRNVVAGTRDDGRSDF
jgi:hypothetical protein